jgi:hypothetical protein
MTPSIFQFLKVTVQGNEASAPQVKKLEVNSPFRSQQHAQFLSTLPPEQTISKQLLTST